jgi:Armadillo/beta-catenin-like repeat
MLSPAEFDIKKEAAWALSNATSGGTHDQIKYLVQIGCIKPLCELLVCSDVRIVTVALEGLENILKVHVVPPCSCLLCVSWCFLQQTPNDRRYICIEQFSATKAWLEMGHLGAAGGGGGEGVGGPRRHQPIRPAG